MYMYVLPTRIANPDHMLYKSSIYISTEEINYAQIIKNTGA